MLHGETWRAPLCYWVQSQYSVTLSPWLPRPVSTEFERVNAVEEMNFYILRTHRGLAREGGEYSEVVKSIQASRRCCLQRRSYLGSPTGSMGRGPGRRNTGRNWKRKICELCFLRLLVLARSMKSSFKDISRLQARLLTYHMCINGSDLMLR
jgi:hypothetical protein